MEIMIHIVPVIVEQSVAPGFYSGIVQLILVLKLEENYSSTAAIQATTLVSVEYLGASETEHN